MSTRESMPRDSDLYVPELDDTEMLRREGRLEDAIYALEKAMEEFDADEGQELDLRSRVAERIDRAKKIIRDQMQVDGWLKR